MEIYFNKIMPEPLKEYIHSENSIWGSDFKILSNKNYILNASSGKGKTTFTNILAGIRKDFEGDVLIDNNSITDFNSNDWTYVRKKRISFVFQDLQLFYNLTVKENFDIKNSLYNSIPLDEIKDMLEIVGLSEKWNQKCSLLSMGQQQRIAIIRALLQPFEFLILDEPFSHLDKQNSEICLKMILERVKKLNAGFLITSLGDYHSFEYDYELFL